MKNTPSRDQKVPNNSGTRVWHPVSIRKEVRLRLDHLSANLKLSISETVSQALDLLANCRTPKANHLNTELLRAAETLEASLDRLAVSLGNLEDAALAITAERVEVMERSLEQARAENGAQKG
jgi:hypothetical protein